MSRTTSQTFKNVVFGLESSDALLFLLQIDKSDLNPSIRVCSNTEPISHLGNTYFAARFTISLPSQKEDIEHVQISVDNVDRALSDAILYASPDDEPVVTLKIVLGSDPDTVEMVPFAYTLFDCSFDLQKITGKLSFENLVQEAFPFPSFTPENFPCMFQ
jgi:hypothetical protein